MNKKVLELLAGTLKLDVEVLTKAVSSEDDVDFKLPELKIFTTEEYTSTIDQIKDNHGKTRYDAGKLAGSEMTFKDMSEKVGFETAAKDADTFISTFKDSILKDANIEPSKKIKELEGSLGKVQDLLTAKESEILDIQNGYKQKETRLNAQSFFPDLPETVGLSKAEAASLYFLSHEVREDGIYKGDSILKDDHEKPLTLEQSISAFVAEKNWNATKPSGRGGGAGGSGGSSNGLPKDLEEFESYIKEKGINVGSSEANALLRDMAKSETSTLN